MLEDKGKIETVLDLVFKEREAYADFFYKSEILNVVIDKRGKFCYVNNKWTEMTRFSEEELCAIPFLVYIHPGDVKKTQKMFESIKEDGGELFSEGFVCRFRVLGGEYKRVSWVSATVSEAGYIMAVCIPLDKKKKFS